MIDEKEEGFLKLTKNISEFGTCVLGDSATSSSQYYYNILSHSKLDLNE